MANIITSRTRVLKFHSVSMPIIRRDGEVWVRGAQIAPALGYKNGEKAIKDIYIRNTAEFTDRMTALVKLPTPGGEQEVRIFSLRGAHLLGMFARTARAAEFRRWVLDVLEQSPQAAPKPAALPAPKVPAQLPQTNLTRNIVGMAAAASVHVQMRVLDALMAGQSIDQADAAMYLKRWLLAFDHTGAPVIKELEADAQVLRTAKLGELLLQDGTFSADEVVSIAWHATWRMHREASERKDSGYLEQLRKQVRALPAHELADIATDAYLSLGIANPIPKHLAKKGDQA